MSFTDDWIGCWMNRSEMLKPRAYRSFTKEELLVVTYTLPAKVIQIGGFVIYDGSSSGFRTVEVLRFGHRTKSNSKTFEVWLEKGIEAEIGHAGAEYEIRWDGEAGASELVFLLGVKGLASGDSISISTKDKPFGFTNMNAFKYDKDWNYLSVVENSPIDSQKSTDTIELIWP